MAEMDGQFSAPTMIDKVVWLRPRDKDGREAIMEGEYPEEYSLFRSLLNVSEHNVEILHESWYKDKKDPRLMVVFRTRFE